jgi:protein involved in polysaccharide export with SLBB domain
LLALPGKTGVKRAAGAALAQGLSILKGRTRRMLSQILRRHVLRAVLLACVCVSGGALIVEDALAQTLGASDIESILQGVQQGQPPRPTQSNSPPLQPSTQTISPQSQGQAQTPSPAPAAPAVTPPSGLEQLFSSRAGVPLKQFGYDVMGVGSPVTATQTGAVQDSYVLGVGDQVQIVMVGHENATYVVTVDRDGRIILLNLPPVVAAGRTLGDVRAELAARISAQFLGTKSFISLGTIRQISVLVTGEVNMPGARTLTALNTAVDAILLSGGIRKTGSLRGVYIVRGTRRIALDLYSIINRGTMGGVGPLQEGDRIVVPPLGGTVAIAGLVRRPGIYELSPGSSRIAVRSLMELAGGMQIAGAKRLTKLELLPDGRTRMISLPSEGSVANGEVLFVDANRSAVGARVTLDGAVTVPGARALGTSPTLSGLLRDSDDLNPNAYTLFAVIVRHDPKSNFLKIVPFSIKGVFDGTENLKLIDNDDVYVFTTQQVRNLATAAATTLYQASQAPGVAQMTQQQMGLGTSPVGTASQAASQGSSPTSPSAPALAQMATTASGLPTVSAPPAQAGQPTQTNTAALLGGGGDTSTAASSIVAPVPNAIDSLAQDMGVQSAALVNLASDYLVWVNGEVLSPGPLLAQSGTSLAAVLEAAGGLQRQADLSGVAVTSTEIDAERGTSRTLRNVYSQKQTDFASVSLRPFDSINVRPVFSDRMGESVTLSGQVRYPGTYEITRDEKLSSVIARAGGLTDEAYPYGAVFTRQSAALAEAQANQREAQMLNSEIATLASQASSVSPISTSNLSYLQTMVQTLAHQPTLGRISVTVDPAVLLAHPERDPLLETGDAIYVPKRPSTVAVTGEVLNAGAFAYKPGLTVDDYIDMAGGETDAAEDSMIFVIMPDGTAVPSHSSWWSWGGSTHIPPGATVVVPRDPQPFNWTTFLATYSDIISKVAVTAASLAVIGRN